jgi:hypothetical protein
MEKMVNCNSSSQKIVEGCDTNIVLFSLKRSLLNNDSNNIFVSNPSLKSSSEKSVYDRLYESIYGNSTASIQFDIDNRDLKYIAYKVNLQWHNGHNPIYLFDKVLFKKYAEKIFSSYLQHRQTGYLYITGFTPMHSCTYNIYLNTEEIGSKNTILIFTSGLKLTVEKTKKQIILRSYYETVSPKTKYQKIYCINHEQILAPYEDDNIHIEITFDGAAKKNTVKFNNKKIITPIFTYNSQKLPYLLFSKSYIKFGIVRETESELGTLKLYEINQVINRSFVTVMGDKNCLPFGIDGPHPSSTVKNGISLISEYGGGGTIWFDTKYIGDNENEIEYWKKVLSSDNWDVGIHYSEELKKMKTKLAYELMIHENEVIEKLVGKKPKSWCSLRNKDSIEHALFAYNYDEMIWRNGDFGVHSEIGVGNLDEETWLWWEKASKAGIIVPLFTHRMDGEFPINYSISYSKLSHLISNYYKCGIKLTSFEKYWLINSNTKYAKFTILNKASDFVCFEAITNDNDALINVNFQVSEKNSTIIDENKSTPVKWQLEQDSTPSFWVENGHTYTIKNVNNSK